MNGYSCAKRYHFVGGKCRTSFEDLSVHQSRSLVRLSESENQNSPNNQTPHLKVGQARRHFLQKPRIDSAQMRGSADGGAEPVKDKKADDKKQDTKRDKGGILKGGKDNKSTIDVNTKGMREQPSLDVSIYQQEHSISASSTSSRLSFEEMEKAE